MAPAPASLLGREAGRLVAAGRSPNARRAAPRSILAAVWRPMSTLAFALVGSGASVWLAQRARRYAVLDRLRVRADRACRRGCEPRLGPHARRRRDRHSGAAGRCRCGPLVGAGRRHDRRRARRALALVAVPRGVSLGGPLVLRACRHGGPAAITAAVPDALERVAAELRAGGTVATAIAWLATDPGPLAGDFATRPSTRSSSAPRSPTRCTTWARERPRPGARSVAGALAVAHAQGGRAADALDSLATSLRERLGGRRRGARAVGPGPLLGVGRRRRPARVPRVLDGRRSGADRTRCSARTSAGCARSRPSRSKAPARGGCAASSRAEVAE